MKKTKLALSLLAGLTIAGSVFALDGTVNFRKLSPKEGGGVERLSNNGKWAVGKGTNPLDGVDFSFPRLVDVKTGDITNLWTDNQPYEQIMMAALDVTDDGVVFGGFEGVPAYWSPDTKTWTELPVPPVMFSRGCVYAVSPDGKYCGGYYATEFSLSGSSYVEHPLVWEKVGDKYELVNLTNVPTVDLTGHLTTEVRLLDVSADGRYFIGQVSFTDPGNGYCFLYDIKNNTWKPIGYSYEGGTFTQLYGNVLYTDGAVFSPSGRYVTGNTNDGNSMAVFRWDLENDNFEILPESEGLLMGTVDDLGVVYASTPENTPIRNWRAYVGKYWYDWGMMSKQLWNLDWDAAVGEKDALTGTFNSVSADGKTLLASDFSASPHMSFLMEIPAPLNEVAGDVDLLANYYVNPMEGAAFAVVKQVIVEFEREIDVIGDANAVSIKDENGNVVRNSISYTVMQGSPRLATATFRNFTMESGKKYQVVFPAGSISIKGDQERTNSEISVNYVGRNNSPVAPVKISPESGNIIEKINVTTNPVVLTFDSDLSVLDNEEKMHLDEKSEESDVWSQIAILNGQVEGNEVRIYPVIEQRLAKGSSYRIVIPAGTFADLSGASPNEEIVIEYKGSFENIPSANKDIFVDDFSNGLSYTNWMFFEGDGNQPDEEVRAWDFTADTTPWWFARDEVNSTDWFATSHSMYNPIGQSYDWMVTKGLWIPDDKCLLSFKSQGYKKGKEDRLKVYVYPTDRVITALTKSIVDDIYYNGVKVYDEIQDPGETEEWTLGEWTENSIDLKQFAGKQVYIAFVNDNYNQSAIFIDDVNVIRDLKFEAAVNLPELVVAQENIKVAGSVTAASATDEITELTLTLFDGEGKEIDKLNPTGLSLKNGAKYDFEFTKPLPLTVGTVNNYTVRFNAGDEEVNYSGRITDLLFQTTKRILLEENTGTNCSFCPQGHRMIEMLDEMYGDLFIPVAIHGYSGGSQFANEFTSEYSSFLGMSAAPSGVIDRTIMAAPMDRDGANWYYTGRPVDLWYDIVAQHLAEPAAADIDIECYVDPSNNNSVSVRNTVKYAYDAKNLNVNILTLLLEDELPGVQNNGIATETSPALGEWANGGRYGTAAPLYMFPHVVRAYKGTTFNGTGGYIHSEVKAGKEYKFNVDMAMPNSVFNVANTKAVSVMIDANTGRVINCARAKSIIETNSVEGIEATGTVSVITRGSEVVVNTPSYADVQIYTIDGKLAAAASGNGEIAVDMSASRGVAIVRVVTDGESIVKKVLVK